MTDIKELAASLHMKLPMATQEDAIDFATRFLAAYLVEQGPLPEEVRYAIDRLRDSGWIVGMKDRRIAADMLERMAARINEIEKGITALPTGAERDAIALDVATKLFRPQGDFTVGFQQDLLQFAMEYTKRLATSPDLAPRLPEGCMWAVTSAPQQIAALTHDVLTATEERDQKDKELAALTQERDTHQRSCEALVEANKYLNDQLAALTKKATDAWHVVATQANQLAASQARETELKQECADRNDCEQSLTRMLIESQAREAKLRERVQHMIDELPTHHPESSFAYHAHLLHETLDLSTDDTVLRQRLAEERERCAEIAETAAHKLGGYQFTAAAIRSMK